MQLKPKPTHILSLELTGSLKATNAEILIDMGLVYGDCSCYETQVLRKLSDNLIDSSFVNSFGKCLNHM